MLGGSLSPQHSTSSGCSLRKVLQQWRVAANILNKQPLAIKNKFVMKIQKESQTWTDTLDKRPKWWNIGMRFRLWNVRSLYRAGSLMTVLRELPRYKVDLVGVQEVRWEGSGTKPSGKYAFVYRKGNDNHELCTGFYFVCKRIISAVKGVLFVSDRMSYIILRGRWCHIIVLNVHAPTEGKTDDVKDSFYKELECVNDKFLKYCMKILLEISMPKKAWKTFLNRQSGMKVYTKLVMIKDLG
jgi:hypothetical protein